MGKLQNKVIIVTGASRGIGAEIASLFAQEGGKIVCAARTLKEGDHPLEGSLEKTVTDIRKNGGIAISVTANISLLEDCNRLFEETIGEYGSVDILVNNAALTYFIPVKDYPINRWMRSWAVNFHAPFMLSQIAINHMIPKNSGSILNISSGAAIGPGRGPYSNVPTGSGGTCYGAEKAALERFSQGLAQEVFEHGISVTCLSPSQVVPTPGTVFHNLVSGINDPKSEHPKLMAAAALLLVTEPVEKITGRVTYSQQILKEYGLLNDAKGTGINPDKMGSGYSKI
jgi:citronellol/citronellal dehydrogenase